MDDRPKPWFYLFFKGPDVIVFNKEGIDAYIANNYKEALEKFNEGITSNPQLSYLHNNRAVVLNEMTRGGNTNYQYTVKAEFEWASELEPHNPIPYENLAHYYGGAPYDKARKYLVKANDCEKRPEWKAWLKKVLEYRY
jgi:Flp pilus assembly protein TadD